MTEPLTLADLIQEHFEGVLETIERGRWGSWLLDRERAAAGQLVLVHEGTGYAVAINASADWATVIAGKDWATASDVGLLIAAIRDLEYAHWLGLIPGPALTAPAQAS